MLGMFVIFLLLAGIWLVFSGFFTPMFLSLGLLSVVASLLVYKLMYHRDEEMKGFAGFWVRLVVYFGWLIKEIVTASLQVTLKVWCPDMKLDPGVAWVPMKLKGNVPMVLMANSITLTPGTVSVYVDVGAQRIYVHALEKSSLKELKQGEMMRKVAVVGGGDIK